MNEGGSAMNLKVGLWQQQTVKLALTQELTQAITLLQYSVQELTSFLESKAMENPLIQLETPNIRVMDPRYDYVKKRKTVKNDDEKSWLEQIAARSNSFVDYVNAQLTLKTFTKKERRIIDHIIYNLDPNGYLTASTREIANMCQATEDEVEACIATVQGLDPAGIAARSLQECLYLQLERKENVPRIALEIIRDHFEDFAEKRWRQLSKELQIEVKDIQEVADIIQTLTPRPGASFYEENPSYIVPDLIVRLAEDGEVEVSLFDDLLPKLRFHQEYYDEMTRYEDRQVNQFLKEKSNDYHWIMKSLEHRQETLFKVGLKIVEKQKDFFLKGPKHLAPLTMKDISEELNIHESTVSRAVREKYMQTPYGTFELKHFFTSSLQTNDAETASSATVKNLIQEWVDQEDKRKPLSDQQIANRLKEYGIIVSRRTVAKYRDQLGIPSSAKRKRFD
jgi:RNA polymerase sigma-54 factor